MDIRVNFTDDDWNRTAQNWLAWWAGELDRPLVIIEKTSLGPDQREFSEDFLLRGGTDEVIDHFQTRLEAMEYYGDAWPKWWPNFGPGIVAGFLGAQMHLSSEDRTIWFEPAEKVAVYDLNLEFDADNFLWGRVKELTLRAVERWKDRVTVGYTDMGMNLDILAHLRTTQNLLFEMVDQADETARLCSQITRSWLKYYDELYAILQKTGRGSSPWADIWSPGKCYMLQSDFAYMISSQMFERFVLPDLAAACQHLDHSFYHLDGKGQIKQLDLLFSLEKLRGIQWVPGEGQPPAEAWLPLLKRIRDAGKLCQVFVTPTGAQKIVQELGGRGFCLCVWDHSLDSSEIKSLIKTLTVRV